MCQNPPTPRGPEVMETVLQTPLVKVVPLDVSNVFYNNTHYIVWCTDP